MTLQKFMRVTGTIASVLIILCIVTLLAIGLVKLVQTLLMLVLS